MDQKIFGELSAGIAELTLIDTHEHLPDESKRDRSFDVLMEYLVHYFCRDLISAGLPEEDYNRIYERNVTLLERWKLVEPYWRYAANTGYGQALTLAVKELYGIDGGINSANIERLNAAFIAARDNSLVSNYNEILCKRSKIDLAIVTKWSGDLEVSEAPYFVYAYAIHEFVNPKNFSELCRFGAQENMSIHSLKDWVECFQKRVTRLFKTPGSRFVALKSTEAYTRNLHYEKTTYYEAEQEFNQLLKSENLPTWRGDDLHCEGRRKLQNYMMHEICRIAEEMTIPMQIHTGLLEGNGGLIYDANPALLSNLFLEYRKLKFDIFHMGYPYVTELGVLGKMFPNVYIDMCWGHIISPEMARRTLSEWLDAVPANKIFAFGGDYVFVDGVYAHQLMARNNVAEVLTERVERKKCTVSEALELAGWLLHDNAYRMFKLERFSS